MISWIQSTFQQHFRVIFLVLLGLIIVSFVAMTPSGSFGNPEKNPKSREFFGVNLASQESSQRMMGDANLSVYLQAGYPALQGAELEQYALQRVAALHLADQWNLPASSDPEITEHIKTLGMFTGQDGQFDSTRYTAFRDSFKTNPDLREGDVKRVLADDTRMEKVQAILSGPGYVVENDIKLQLARADSIWTLGLATINLASFNPAINAGDLELNKFFSDNAARYEIPAQVVGSYADFPAQAYVSEVVVSEGDIRAYYDANPSRFTAPKDPKITIATDANADFLAARAQVEAALRLEKARRIAVKAASDLSFALYDGKVTVDSPQLATLLAARKVTLKPLAPFSQAQGPSEFGGSAEIGAEAFKLTRDRFFSDALPTPAGAAVVFWKETLPSRQPAFAEVREKVRADFTAQEKNKRFVELGQTIKALIANRIKAGDSFDQAVAAVASSTSAKIEASTTAPFSRRQPPQDLDYAVYGVLENLEKGQVSDMIPSGDKGVIVYAADKKAPVVDSTNAQYALAKSQLSSLSSRITTNAYLGEMVMTELKRTEPPAR